MFVSFNSNKSFKIIPAALDQARPKEAVFVSGKDGEGSDWETVSQS